MRAVIEAARLQQNSVGGSIECAAIGLPVGVGGNMFSTVESKLSALLFGIPAVKGVQFGLGFDFAGCLWCRCERRLHRSGRKGGAVDQ